MSKEKKRLDIGVNPLDAEKKASLTNRILVAFAMLAVIIPCVILGGYFFFFLIFAAAVLAIYEFIHAPRKKYRWYVWMIVYASTLGFIYWAILKWNVDAYLSDRANYVFSPENNYRSLFISIYGIAIEMGLLFFCAVAHEDFSIYDIAYLFLMSVLIGIGMQSLLYVRYLPFEEFASAGYDTSTKSFAFWGSLVYFFFVELTTIMTDTWAYFVGVFFGKHKMNPRVSPKKTWEGFFGGWILGGLTGLAFAMINDACGRPLLPSMRIFGEGSQWWWAVLLSFSLPLTSTLGDLSFSFVKRHFGIKDYSKIFGAHGGMLDRADSIIFSTIFAGIMAVFVSGGWNVIA
mgnify:CR=1 FL=1